MQHCHLVIVRTGGSIIDLNSYNCQELGLAKSLIKKGFKVSLVFAGKKREKAVVQTSYGIVDVYFLNFFKINQALSWFYGIDNLLKSLHPDCIQIHEFGMLMSWRVAQWAKKHNVKCVLIQGSYQTTQKPIFKQLELFFNVTFGKNVLNLADAVGTKTKMASYYVNSVKQTYTQLTYIGLDTKMFDDAVQHNWRRELSIADDKKLLLYIGVFEPRRNPLFLIDVLALLPDDYVMIMAGGGYQWDIVKQKMIELGFDGKRCHLLGKVSQKDVPSLYQSSDLFLLASDYEIYGMVILEAMYFGLPIMSTKTAGSDILIESGVDGILLGDKQPQNWAKSIISLFNSNILDTMSKKAHKKIISQFLWEKTCEGFIKLYRTVIN